MELHTHAFGRSLCFIFNALTWELGDLPNGVPSGGRVVLIVSEFRAETDRYMYQISYALYRESGK